jgi:hypothetical protein
VARTLGFFFKKLFIFYCHISKKIQKNYGGKTSRAYRADPFGPSFGGGPG